jgi:flavin-binding protein dodecin
MAEPFESRSRKKLARIPSIGTSGRKRAFLAELESKLAAANRIADVDLDGLRALADEQGIDLANDVANPRRRLYRRFFEHCLVDYALSEDEREDLAHLQALLHLSDADAASLHDETACAIYGKAIADVLDDFRLDSDERAFLNQLRGEIGISESEAESIEQQGASEARRRFINQKVVLERPVLPGESAQVELEGVSESSLHDAVEVAIQSASITVPGIEAAELKTLRVEIDGEVITRWSVTLTTTL